MVINRTFEFEYAGPDFQPVIRFFGWIGNGIVCCIVRFMSRQYYVASWHNGREIILYGTYRFGWIGMIHVWRSERTYRRLGARFRHDIRVERNRILRGKSAPARICKTIGRVFKFVDVFTYNLVNW